MDPTVASVSLSSARGVSKQPTERIRLVAGLGVEGDVHKGPTVRHRSRMRTHPGQPNLRQVHLIHAELHEELAGAGFDVGPGQMGENITTRDVDLLALPAGTTLSFGDRSGPRIRLTGLRNPCAQLDGLAPGLMAATVERTDDGRTVRKSGVMAVVERGGEVRVGDVIHVERSETAQPLEPV